MNKFAALYGVILDLIKGFMLYIIAPIALLLFVAATALIMLSPDQFKDNLSFFNKPLTLGGGLYLVFFSNLITYMIVSKDIEKIRNYLKR